MEFSLGTLDVRRIYRICADTPAIACDTYLKGSAAQLPDSRTVNAADRKNIESTADMQSQPVAATLDRFNPGGFHWHTRIVEFQDVTDWNNNLVFETDVIPYRKNAAIRRLAARWGLPLVEFDRNIGFSKDTPNPATGTQQSLLHAQDTQTIEGVAYGWHPQRGQDKYIQQRMAAIFTDTMRRILPAK